MRKVLQARKWLAAICTAAAVMALLAPGVSGQEQRSGDLSAAGLTVSPAIFEVVAKPGATVEKDFSIQNVSDQPMPVAATVDRLRPSEPEIDLARSESFNASQWVTIDQPYHILDVKEQRQLKARVTAPKNAEPGGHYATILLQPQTPVTGTSGDTARIAPQIGILVFITVPGDAKASVKANTNVGRLHWTKDIALGVDFANTGNIHALPTAKVTVRNVLGKAKAELPLQPRIVLPNTIRRFQAEWSGAALFGIYSAELEATYGPSQTPFTSGKRYFVVVRWLPLIFWAVILVPLGLFVHRTYRRWPAAIRAFRAGSSKSRESKIK